MAKDESEALFHVPEELRKELMDCAVAKQISIEWLVNLYRRGFNAKMGATGQHPYGKLGEDDEGELNVAMAVDRAQGVIRMVFGKPVAWLALPAGHARHLAKMLEASADELDRMKH